MTEQRKSIHGTWSSRWTFILAATGSAVGLGNIWKFPYMAGDNGGGAFVLIYLACIFVIGIPIMLGEIMIGRRGRSSPANTMKYLAKEAGTSTSLDFAWSYRCVSRTSNTFFLQCGCRLGNGICFWRFPRNFCPSR